MSLVAEDIKAAPNYICDIKEDSDVRLAVNLAKYFAQELKFNDFNVGMISIAVAEIATNAIRYGNGGHITYESIANGNGLAITVEDHGHGISDLSLAFTDGYSTNSEPSLGLGLGAAKRSVDEMVINKSDHSGTSITLRHYLPLDLNNLQTSAVSFPKAKEYTNGDEFIIKGYEHDKLLIAVIDGEGSGKKAQESAAIAKRIINENYKRSFQAIIKMCEEEFENQRLSRACQLALLRITPTHIDSLILGNLRIFCGQNCNLHFPIHQGSIGIKIPQQLETYRQHRPTQFLIGIHTDGIKRSINIEIENDKSLPKKAAMLFDKYAIAEDDATLILVKGTTL